MAGVPVQVVGGLVQECVILSDKLSPDQLGTWLLHHHFFGQLEISAEEEELLDKLLLRLVKQLVDLTVFKTLQIC